MTYRSLALAALSVVTLLSLGGAATASAVSPPAIESESAANITQTEATLEAQIDPNGAYTGYEFQIDTNSSYNVPRAACPFDLPGYAECEALITGEPLPPGLVEPSPAYIPASSGGQSVSLDLASIGATLQPGTTYHYRVIAENGGNPIVAGPDQTFTTPSADTVPLIGSESTSNITATDATLEAEINLHEAPAGVYYQFQLVGDPSEYASEILCPPTLQPGNSGCIGPQGSPALPIGFLPGNTLQPSATSHASLDLAGAGVNLQPGTTYHYRVLAARAVQTEDTIEWESPTVDGADQTFTTPSAGTAPLVESEAASNISPTDATLEAQINTEGLETTYIFYLHEEGPPCLKADPPCMVLEKAPIPLPSGKLLGSFVGQNVSAELNSAGVSLTPGRSYEYWATATSAAGTTKGQAQTFTAPSEPGVEPLKELGGSTNLQTSPAIQSPSPSSAPHHRRHRHHRRHKRGLHRRNAHRAKRAG